MRQGLKSRGAVPSAALAGAAALATALIVVAVAEGAAVRYTPAQSLYLEGCGGCHGILGSSSEKDIPELRGEVGWFLCTPAGREYIIRLPNVAFAAADDQALADMMNFVVFSLGGSSTPVGAAPYTAGEVGVLRRQPLKNQPLAQMRDTILADVARHCERREDQVVYKK